LSAADIPLLAVLAGVAAVGAVFFAWLVRLERSDRPHVAVIIVLALLVVDGALYENPNDVPNGIFHPEIHGQPFRLPDIVVPLALAAAVVGGRRSGRMGAQSFWWLAFLAWLGTEAVLGLIEGNSSTLVSFEAKAIIYLGAMALAARVPFQSYADGVAFRRLIYAAAALAALLSVLEPRVRLSFHLPGLSVPTFGALGGDPASIFAALGIIAFTLAVCGHERRAGLLVAAVVLVVPALISGQRAALLGLVASAVILVMLAPLAWRRLFLPPHALYGIAAAAAAIFLIPWMLVASIGPQAPIAASATPPAFFASAVDSAFHRQGAHSSAESRINQWQKTSVLVRERPVLGFGLGERYVYWDPGLYTFVETDLSHDVPLDLLRRTGIIGLGLFLVALAVSISRGVRVWRYDSNPAAAALAVACVSVIGGLLTKSLVESILEKYRLVVLLGLVLGMLHSCIRSNWALRSGPPTVSAG
jgi:O-antigen ligase